MFINNNIVLYTYTEFTYAIQLSTGSMQINVMVVLLPNKIIVVDFEDCTKGFARLSQHMSPVWSIMIAVIESAVTASGKDRCTNAKGFWYQLYMANCDEYSACTVSSVIQSRKLVPFSVTYFYVFLNLKVQLYVLQMDSRNLDKSLVVFIYYQYCNHNLRS